MSKLLLTLCLVIAILAVPASAVTFMCPWGDPQEFVPTTPITIESVYGGSCTGVTAIYQKLSNERVDNGTQQVGSYLSYVAIDGTSDVALQNMVYNGELGVSVMDAQDFTYTGSSASLMTSHSGFEASNGEGNDTPINCLFTSAGTRILITDGQYSGIGETKVMGHLNQQYAMASTGNGMITTFSNSNSLTGLQFADVTNPKPVGKQEQSFSATMMGKYDVQYAYNYKAGI